MTPIYDKPIESKMAWRGCDIRSKDEVARDLTRAHVVALEEILGRVSKIPRQEIRREDCRHPLIDDFLSEVFTQAQCVGGFVLLRGVPVKEHSDEDVERIYWAIGTHFGRAESQNSLGNTLNWVQQEKLPGGVQSPSGTKSSGDLAPHTDPAEFFTLLCVRQAREGGNTQFGSTLAIHNEILATRPDILPILYKGFPIHRRGYQYDDQPAVTPYDVPIFSNVNGTVSSTFAIAGIVAALHTLGREMTAEEREALLVFQKVTLRLQFDTRLEPGEMSVVNNFTTIHSRSQYVDWDEPERRRLLMRLWLHPWRDQWPVVPEINVFENKEGRFGLDHIPGREVAANEYFGMTDELQEICRRAQRRFLSEAAS